MKPSLPADKLHAMLGIANVAFKPNEERRLAIFYDPFQS
jgi:hypothetical protein